MLAQSDRRSPNLHARLWVVLLCLLVLISVQHVGFVRAEEPDQNAAKQSAATNPDEINDRLTNKRISAKFEAIPLADAIDLIGSTADVNTFIDWKALESLGIDHDASVTLKLRNPVSAAQALRLVLRIVNPALTFSVEDEVIVITGSGDAKQPQPPAAPDLETRVYDVNDILAGGGTGESLSQLISQTITPDIWKADAGAPKVTPLGKLLVISASQETHDQINELLFKLRRATPTGAVPDKPAEEKKDTK
jgi:hypothetical protein